MPQLPGSNPAHSDPGPDQRLRDLQRRFRAVSRRDRTTTKLRWAIAAFSAIAVIFVVYPAIWLLISSPWPVATTLRHIASAPNCEFARLVGLAPSRRGEPGYWKHHDRDRDGIACEPWPAQR
ncbi:excalibur calcium-binding domain-containing protein [Bradyrhizobium manausense]|uniref:excalibur calcium-binding domain-containing protein n=1 Tax=Bradyrhizobium manausense TaxID=989370 RepID=UPI001BA7DAE7|nr:excalibur calcium-binding domain-containing protein [Bradyrhizobium manausense]MBR0792149.1 excalibur calcium-binding domain-containing protein [Bradyrhizobium manausense]